MANIDVPDDVIDLADGLLALGADKDLVDMARSAIGEHPAEPGYWLELAKVFRQRGEFDAALRVYEGARWRFAELPQLWNNRGILLAEWRRLDEAIMSFDRAISLQPDYLNALEGKGNALELAGMPEDAEPVYRRALEIAPERANSWNNLGNCRKAAGDLDGARDAYQRALAIEPDHDDARFNLAHLEDEYLPPAPSSRGLNPDAAVVEQMLRRAKLLNEKAGVLTWDPSRLEREPIADPGAQYPRLHPPTADTPRLFISYAWARDRSAFTDEEVYEFDMWLDALAGHLFSIGYDLVFDRDPRNLDKGLGSLDVLLRMNDCNFFVPIVAEEYAERVAPDSPRRFGWSVTEWDHACRLAERGYLRFIGIWYSGSVLPPPLLIEESVDLREDPNPWDGAMNAMFPPAAPGQRGRPALPPPVRPPDPPAWPTCVSY